MHRAAKDGPSYVLNSSGECDLCKKSAANSFVTCLFCQLKFHAVGCNTANDICTATFLNMFKPLSEKVGSTNSKRPGNFTFVCDPCLTSHEHKLSMKTSNQYEDLQQKVSNMETDLAEIKAILLDSNANKESDFTQCKTKFVQPSNCCAGLIL